MLVFEERGKPEYPEKKTSWSKGENQQETQPTYGVKARIWTLASLVGSAWVPSPLHQFPNLLPPLGASKIQVVTWVDIPVNKDSNDYMLAPVLCIAGVFPHT